MVRARYQVGDYVGDYAVLLLALFLLFVSVFMALRAETFYVEAWERWECHEKEFIKPWVFRPGGINVSNFESEGDLYVESFVNSSIK